MTTASIDRILLHDPEMAFRWIDLEDDHGHDYLLTTLHGSHIPRACAVAANLHRIQDHDVQQTISALLAAIIDDNDRPFVLREAALQALVRGEHDVSDNLRQALSDEDAMMRAYGLQVMIQFKLAPEELIPRIDDLHRLDEHEIVRDMALLWLFTLRPQAFHDQVSSKNWVPLYQRLASQGVPILLIEPLLRTLDNGNDLMQWLESDVPPSEQVARRVQDHVQRLVNRSDDKKLRNRLKRHTDNKHKRRLGFSSNASREELLRAVSSGQASFHDAGFMLYKHGQRNEIDSFYAECLAAASKELHRRIKDGYTSLQWTIQRYESM
jgi:hypothetical protein